ncbi:MAG: hypothetical protein QOG10_4575 [Kribbellaceae bacterium]|nr:hypothetical protein [Kribbellaceae bacterium]
MAGDQSVAGLGIGSGEHLPDLAYRHFQVSEAPDHLSRRYLCRGVVPIAAVRVDLGWLEQPRVVVVPQCLHAEMCDLRELADAQVAAHESTVNPPSAGGSIGVICETELLQRP